MANRSAQHAVFGLVQDGLCGAGMQAELGFAITGTTDAVLKLQQSVSVGAAANGIRWL